MAIFYGVLNKYFDITQKALEKCISTPTTGIGSIKDRSSEHDVLLCIPQGEKERCDIFGDPCYGTLKHIVVLFLDGTYIKYPFDAEIKLKKNSIWETPDAATVKLEYLHKNLDLQYGTFSEEYPEQYMVARFLSPTAKVLEIGGNIGRNSLIISSILNDSANLVVLETMDEYVKKLRLNRDNNNLSFHIESSALSLRNIIQKGWNSIPSNDMLPGYQTISTIGYNTLLEKYNLNFDTLVVDCEGAFYHILIDFPDLLKNINLVVIENDFFDLEHKKYVDSVFTSHGLVRKYKEPGGWGPCYHFFYEVWEK